jgi:hypothetical protein
MPKKTSAPDGGETMTFDLSHARHDPAHCLAPGLFRSVARGERKKHKLDITYAHGPLTLRFVGFEPLGADDMRLLQGLIALGGPRGVLLHEDPQSDIGKQLRLFLDPKLEAASSDALVVKEYIGRLMTEIGYETDGGPKRAQIIESLVRMANVTCIAKEGEREASYHLLAYAADGGDGRLFVALNPRLTNAILGRRQFARVELAEVRALKSDPARLMHQRLCGWIDPGRSGRAELATLCEYVWPVAADQQNTLKKRKASARKALRELSQLGWRIVEYASQKFEIGRPPAAVP